MSAAVSERCQHKATLKEAIQKVYESKDFADATFTVGCKKFKVHKLIVASRCSEFARLLLEPNAAVDHTVEEESVTEIGFELLLRFIYTDTLGTNDKQSILKAYLAAKYYQQKKLMEKCESLMKTWILTVGEVCELLNVSFDVAEAKKMCLDFIKSHAAEVIDSPTFFDLNYAAMTAILDNDALNTVAIKTRFIKIVEWGSKKKKDPENYAAVKKNDPANYAAVRDYFLKNNPPLLGKLKIEEFVLTDISDLFIGTYKTLLTPDEILKFMEYQNVKNRAVLPEWCTTP